MKNLIEEIDGAIDEDFNAEEWDSEEQFMEMCADLLESDGLPTLKVLTTPLEDLGA